MNLSEVTRRAEGTLETVESFGVGYGQGAGTSTGDWMKPPRDLFLYCDMKDLGPDMVFIQLQFSPLFRHVFITSNESSNIREFIGYVSTIFTPQWEPPCLSSLREARVSRNILLTPFARDTNLTDSRSVYYDEDILYTLPLVI